MKFCTNKKCSQINPQPFSSFSKCKDNPDGYKYKCKSCYHQDYELNIEKNLLRQKKYRNNNKEEIIRKQKIFYKNDPRKNIFYNAKKRAKEKQLLFNITIDDIIIPQFCPYFNIPLFVGEGTFSDNSPSLDRMKPELGYTKGNIEVISNRANRIKSDGTIKEHSLIIKRMKQF